MLLIALFVSISFDLFGQWVDMNLNYKYNYDVVLYADKNDLFAFDSDNQILNRSINNGVTWTRMSIVPGTPDIVESLYKSGNNIYIAAYDGIYISHNNGVSFTLKGAGIRGSSIINIGTDIFMGTYENGILKYSPTKDIFEPIAYPNDYIFLLTDGTNIYVTKTVTNANIGVNTYFYSIDKGVTFQILNGFSSSNPPSSFVRIKDKIYASDAKPSIRVSQDNANSFNVDLPIANPYAYKLLGINDTLYCALSDNIGILYHDTLNNTFTSFSQGMSRTGGIKTIELIYGTNYLYAITLDGFNTNNLKMYRRYIGKAIISDLEDKINSNLLITPNPSIGIINIQSTSESKYFEKKEIYNIEGKLLYSTKEIQNTIDITFLHNGLYFLKCYDANKVYIGKFIKE
jgi:Secretion system C-terminal sorting domain